MISRFAAAFLLFSTVLCGQSVANHSPFEKYPAERVYKGTPVQPKLDRDQRYYRTVIREGAKSQVEFAGHYTVPRFGCGTGCTAFYIVDSATGRVYDGFGISDLPMHWIEKQSGDAPPRIEFLASSRLLRINGCPNERDCGYYDYVMLDGKGLKLVHEWLLPKEFQ